MRTTRKIFFLRLLLVLGNIRHIKKMSQRVINRRPSLQGWIEILDNTTKKFYYHNPQTNQISWLHPKYQKQTSQPVSQPKKNETQEKTPTIPKSSQIPKDHKKV